MCQHELTSKGDILIKDSVWLGMGVRIMDGVRIGGGAIIGANAAVTKDIPPVTVQGVKTSWRISNKILTFF